MENFPNIWILILGFLYLGGFVYFLPIFMSIRPSIVKDTKFLMGYPKASKTVFFVFSIFWFVIIISITISMTKAAIKNLIDYE